MKMKVLLFTALLTLGLFQTAFAQTAATDAATVKTTPDTNAPELHKGGYLVGPGDVITGKILGESQFDFTATIDQDGKFQVPFFDRPIMAKCRTERELRNSVSQLLSKYLKTPLVSVSVAERKSRPPASIYGEVRTPQQVDLRRRVTLIELLAFAGGVTEEAGGMIQVFRTQPPLCSEDNAQNSGFAVSNSGSGGGDASPADVSSADVSPAGVSLADVPSRLYSLSNLKQGREEANPVVYPGDIIVVLKAAPVYITGEVIQRTGIRLPEGGLSLTQAIAMVGGVNREAKTKEIKIYRLKADSKDREIISANYDSIKKGAQKDVMLAPYDIVEVDKSKKSVQQLILETVVGVGRTAATGAGGLIVQRIIY